MKKPHIVSRLKTIRDDIQWSINHIPGDSDWIAGDLENCLEDLEKIIEELELVKDSTNEYKS